MKNRHRFKKQHITFAKRRMNLKKINRILKEVYFPILVEELYSKPIHWRR